MNMPKRNRSVSVMKGIGIFCVVLGHASLTRYLSPLIRVIQLPIFWWVAGWTFDYSKYGKNVGKLLGARLHKFMVPYMGYMFLLMLCHNWFYEFGIMDGLGGGIYVTINDYFTAFTGYFLLGYELLCGAVWFMAPFLISTILFGNIVCFTSLICKEDIKKVWIWTTLISFLIGIFGMILIEIGVITGYRFEMGMLMLPVITVGRIVNMNYSKIEKFINPIGVILSIGIMYGTYFYYGKIINLGSNEIVNPCFFYIIVGGGLYFVMYLIKIVSKLKENNWIVSILALFGDYSLDIMILHMVFFRLLFGINLHIGKPAVEDYTTFVFSNWGICLVIGITLPILVRKICELIYGKIFIR